ncbi:MAG TPA: PQQ-binding-like beta-propeller repeat protein [Thermomicrobiales bacterium]|jgi:outer membrane protein assembly factor BamB
MNGDPRFLPSGDRDRAAAQLGRFWDTVVAGGAELPDVAPELADLATVVRRLDTEPRDPAPTAVHAAIRDLIAATPSWSRLETVPVTADPREIVTNGHVSLPPAGPATERSSLPRGLRRLLPIVEFVGLAAVIVALLYVAFGRDHQSAAPTTPTVAPTTVPTATTAPITPTAAPGAVGDWPMLGGGPGRSGGGDRSIPAGPPVMRWSAALAPNIRFPVVAGDAVYVTDGCTLFALDAATGTERWRFDLGVAPSVAGANPPAIVAGTVYIAGVDGTIFAIEAATGHERWRKPTGEKITTAVAVAQDAVFAGTVDGTLYALDAATGEQRWSAAIGPVTASSPVITDGSLFVAAEPDQVLAFDATTGKPLWKRTISVGMRSIAVGEGIAVVASRTTGGNTFTALDAANGDLRWSNHLGSDPPPVIAGGLVFTASPESVGAIDAATGGQRWGFEATTKVVQFALAGDALLLCRENGTVVALDARTGVERWRIETGAGATGTALGAGVLYVARMDGMLAAYT